MAVALLFTAHSHATIGGLDSIEHSDIASTNITSVFGSPDALVIEGMKGKPVTFGPSK